MEEGIGYEPLYKCLDGDCVLAIDDEHFDLFEFLYVCS